MSIYGDTKLKTYQNTKHYLSGKVDLISIYNITLQKGICIYPMKKKFLHVKNMKNSNSSIPSISSQKRTPYTVMTSVGRNDDRLCSESGVANLGINNPQLPLNGEGFQWFWVLSSHH